MLTACVHHDKGASFTLHWGCCVVPTPRTAVLRSRGGVTYSGETRLVQLVEERLKKTLPWQRVGNSEDTAVRAKQRLQGFQRK